MRKLKVYSICFLTLDETSKIRDIMKQSGCPYESLKNLFGSRKLDFYETENVLVIDGAERIDSMLKANIEY